MQYITNIFAQTYGSGDYGNSTYQNGTTTTTGSTGSGSAGGGTSGGVLTDTGFDILLAATLACVLLFTAVVVRFWKRPAKNPSTNE